MKRGNSLLQFPAMKRTTLSLIDVLKVSGREKMPPRPATVETMPPPPAIFAPFLNTGEDTRLATTGRASSVHVIPITVEPRTSTMDRSGHGTAEAHTPASTMPDTTPSTTSETPAPFGVPQGTKLHGPMRRPHTLPLRTKTKAAYLEGQPGSRRGLEAMIQLCACTLVLLVGLLLLSFIFFTNDAEAGGAAEVAEVSEAAEPAPKPDLPPARATPVAGHVGAPCNDSAPCLGESHCVEGVCRCKGPGIRVVKGVCVPVTTSVTKQTRTRKIPSAPAGSGKTTRPPVARFALVSVVRLDATSTSTTTGTTPVTIAGRTQSAIRFQDRSSHRTLDTQSRTSEVFGTTSSHAFGKASSISSSIMSDPLATSSASQFTKLSSTAKVFHALPLVDKSKAAGLKEHSQQREGAHALLPFYACILILLVLFILHSLILLAPSKAPRRLYAETNRARQAAKRTPKPNIALRPPKHIVGHVGVPCNDSAPCLGEAHCVGGVCRCNGPAKRIMKGVCVSVPMTATKKPQPPNSATILRDVSTETLPPVTRFASARTVRLGAPSASANTETPPATNGEDPGQDTTEVGGTVYGDVEARGTTASNATSRVEGVQVEKTSNATGINVHLG
ncbi:uncharacterized protein [Dermacentor albipictus]|uniref:uncharacterized protein isoform X3 n=1 Tax=Dermacentor albipictus TaxID=60249 RepID=UPI0038FC1276